MRIINLKSPQGWYDLTPAQLLMVAELFIKAGAGEIDEPEFLTRALISLTGLIPLKRKVAIDGERLMFVFKTPGEKPFLISSAEIHEMATRLKWLLEAPGICTPPNLLKYIPVNYQLLGVPLEQYLLADAHYIRFAKTKDRPILNKFAAALYRDNEDQPWSNQAWKQRVPEFAKLSLAELYSVFIWFTGEKAWIAVKYPYIFPTSTGSVGEWDPNEQILQLLSSLNGGDVTRNRLILETHVHEVLFELNLKIEQSQNK